MTGKRAPRSTQRLILGASVLAVSIAGVSMAAACFAGVGPPPSETPTASRSSVRADAAAVGRGAAAEPTFQSIESAYTPPGPAPAPTAQMVQPLTSQLAPAPMKVAVVASTPALSDPGPGNPYARATAALKAVVPERWRQAVSARIEIIEGWTSWSVRDGPIRVGAQHIDTWARARYVVAHEWAHQAAYRYGTGAYLGAPPPGFPGRAQSQAEQWAECVALHLADYQVPSSYPDCPADAMAWTRSWLAAGPPD